MVMIIIVVVIIVVVVVVVIIIIMILIITPAILLMGLPNSQSCHLNLVMNITKRGKLRCVAGGAAPETMNMINGSQEQLLLYFEMHAGC